MNFYCILLIVIFTISCFDCFPYHYVTKREKYCGKRLTDMLFIVCQGKYYNPRSRKSTNNNFDNDYVSDTGLDYGSNSVYPFLQNDLFSVMPNKVRKSHGVVDECCHNPCTVETMQAYCE